MFVAVKIKGSVRDLVHKISRKRNTIRMKMDFFLEIGIQLFPFFKTVFLIFLWLVFYTVYERCDHTCLPGKRSVETVDGFADLQTCSLIAWSDSGINT